MIQDHGQQEGAEAGSTNDYEVFVLKFIDHIIQWKPLSKISKIICKRMERDGLGIAGVLCKKQMMRGVVLVKLN